MRRPKSPIPKDLLSRSTSKFLGQDYPANLDIPAIKLTALVDFVYLARQAANDKRWNVVSYYLNEACRGFINLHMCETCGIMFDRPGRPRYCSWFCDTMAARKAFDALHFGGDPDERARG